MIKHALMLSASLGKGSTAFSRTRILDGTLRLHYNVALFNVNSIKERCPCGLYKLWNSCCLCMYWPSLTLVNPPWCDLNGSLNIHSSKCLC